jgi:hypothetical protein
MRGGFGVVTLYLALAGLSACETRAEPPPPRGESRAPQAGAQRIAALSAQLEPLPPPRPLSSAVVAVSRSLQATALRLAPAPGHAPRLVLGKGVLGQLTDDGLRVYSSRDASLLVSAPLEKPRALLTLADGALLALGAVAMLRVELGHEPALLPKPVLLPGADVFADAVQPDRIWILESRRTPPQLSGYRLTKGSQGVLLPEQEIELESPAGGVVGMTREGVWLYFTPGRAERFGPSGARLKGLTTSELVGPFFSLPTRRLDQQYFIDERGQLTRALVTPHFRKLSRHELGLAPLAAAVADEGRLLAIVAVVGEGPSFELRLFDEALSEQGRAVLPAEPPTGRDDWVQVVTRNLHLAAGAREPLVAVGGPDRALIFDARAKQVLSIPSR